MKLLSHVRLSDPMDCSLPGSSIHGIFQARVLEWDAIAFSANNTLLISKFYIELIYFLLGMFYWSRQWQPTPVLLPGKSHGRRSLVGYSPWGCRELDMTERLHFDFSLSCTGGGNGNPLQCSCLENPMDREASRAIVYGVARVGYN